LISYGSKQLCFNPLRAPPQQGGAQEGGMLKFLKSNFLKNNVLKDNAAITSTLKTAHNLILLSFCAALIFFEPQASYLLALDRAATLDQLELWRLLSGHWVHLGPEHYLLNAVGLGLIVLIFHREHHWLKDIIAFTIISLATSWMLLEYTKTVASYVGLSGVLHGYFVYYLAAGAKTTPWINLIAWIGTLGKVFHEQLPSYDSSATAELINGQVAVDAHLYGFISGTAIGALMLLFLWMKNRAHAPTKP